MKKILLFGFLALLLIGVISFTTIKKENTKEKAKIESVLSRQIEANFLREKITDFTNVSAYQFIFYGGKPQIFATSEFMVNYKQFNELMVDTLVRKGVQPLSI
jgi:hypothetical protein